MAIAQTLLDYLQEHCVTYRREKQRATGPSNDLSISRNAAKTIVFRSKDELLMLVLNEDRIVDMEAIKKIVGCDDLSVVPEEELFDRFGPCEPAAIPPFGTLFHIPIYCDRMLAQQPEIEFRAGTVKDTIRMPLSEFVQIEAPTMADFSSPSDPTRSAA
jgi:Ala-tRNA(Pro) deacylase